MTSPVSPAGTKVRLLLPRGGVRETLQLVVLPYLFLSLLFHGLVQLQHAVFGRVVVFHQHLRIAGLAALLMLGIVYVFQSGRLRIERPRLVSCIAAYCFYLALDFAVKASLGQVRFGALVYAEANLYFYTFFLLFVLVLASNNGSGARVNLETKAFRALYLAAVPVFVIGYAQFLLNDPLLYVADESGYAVQVYINTKLSHVRAFSLFGSGFGYGQFVTLVGSLAAAFFVEGREKRLRVVFGWLLVAATLAIITTYTRNAYIQFALTLTGVFLIRRLVRAGWANLAIVTTGITCASMAYLGIVVFFLVSPGLAQGILDVETFGTRLVLVGGVVSRFFLAENDAAAVLFGHGYIQNPKFGELQGIRPLLFDNSYVDVALFSGLVGLALYLLVFVLLFLYVLDKYRCTGSYWWLALAGTYFAYPLVAAINIYVSMLYLVTCIVVVYDTLAHRFLAAATPDTVTVRGAHSAEGPSFRGV